MLGLVWVGGKCPPWQNEEKEQVKEEYMICWVFVVFYNLIKWFFWDNWIIFRPNGCYGKILFYLGHVLGFYLTWKRRLDSKVGRIVFTAESGTDLNSGCCRKDFSLQYKGHYNSIRWTTMAPLGQNIKVSLNRKDLERVNCYSLLQSRFKCFCYSLVMCFYFWSFLILKPVNLVSITRLWSRALDIYCINKAIDTCGHKELPHYCGA